MVMVVEVVRAAGGERRVAGNDAMIEHGSKREHALQTAMDSRESASVSISPCGSNLGAPYGCRAHCLLTAGTLEPVL